MAPTISVSNEVYDALKRRSKSWEDTPGKIIAELLGIDEKPRAPIRKKNYVPGVIIEKIIFFALGNTIAGAGSSEEIISLVLELMKEADLIKEDDLEKIASRGTRIEMQIKMCLHDLKKAGYFNHSTQNGIWDLIKEDGIMNEVREIIDNNKLFTKYLQGSDKSTNTPCPKVTYRDSRLCFKREYIEHLNPEESFRIVCGSGIFQMTKNEFYKVFDNVVNTSSYQERGQYHSKIPPRKAIQFKIF